MGTNHMLFHPVDTLIICLQYISDGRMHDEGFVRIHFKEAKAKQYYYYIFL